MELKVLKENDIIEYLKTVLDNWRFVHSLSVATTAANLASVYNVDVEKARLAGLLHDITKNMPFDQQIKLLELNGYHLSTQDMNAKSVVHGYSGAYLSREKYNIDNDVFRAIFTHTMGEPGMSDLQKIIFVSDYIEPFRDNIDGIDDLRKMAFNNLDLTVYSVSKRTLDYLVATGRPIHSQTVKVCEFYKNLNNL